MQYGIVCRRGTCCATQLPDCNCRTQFRGRCTQPAAGALERRGTDRGDRPFSHGRVQTACGERVWLRSEKGLQLLLEAVWGDLGEKG